MCELGVREKVDVFDYQSVESQGIVREFLFMCWVWTLYDFSITFECMLYQFYFLLAMKLTYLRAWQIKRMGSVGRVLAYSRAIARVSRKACILPTEMGGAPLFHCFSAPHSPLWVSRLQIWRIRYGKKWKSLICWQILQGLSLLRK